MQPSKAHFALVFALGTAVFVATQRGIVPEYAGFGALLVLTLVIRVMLANSAPKDD